MNLFSLNGQTALVTGSAKGIGKGIAEVLKKAGANVVIADIDRENGEKTAAALGGHYQYLDVRSQQSCREAVEQVVKQHGKIDILCSNTGIFPQKKLSRNERSRLGQHPQHQPERHVFYRSGGLKRDAAAELRADCDYLVDYRPGNRFSRVEPLRRQQSRTARLYAQCSA